MKHFKAFVFLLFPALLSAQAVTYSYSLDTFHIGGNLRVDSLYLIEIVTGFLVNSDATLGTEQRGDRDQSLETPIFFSDTAALTRYANNLLQDSINLAAKIQNLKTQANLAGEKARAIQEVRDSVIYGAWLYEIENPYQFKPGNTDTRMGMVDGSGDTENWVEKHLEARHQWVPFMEERRRQKSPPKKE